MSRIPGFSTKYSQNWLSDRARLDSFLLKTGLKNLLLTTYTFLLKSQVQPDTISADMFSYTVLGPNTGTRIAENESAILLVFGKY